MKELQPTYEELIAYTHELEAKLKSVHQQPFTAGDTFLHQLPISLLHISGKGQILAANSQFLQTFSYLNTQLPGKIDELIPAYTQWVSVEKSDRPTSSHLWLIDGKKKQRKVHLHYVHSTNNEKEFTLLIEDRSRENELEEQLTKQENTLQDLIQHNQHLSARINKQQREIDKLQEQFTILDKNLPGVVYLCLHDKHFTMLHMNEKIEEITGVPNTAFLKQEKTFKELIHPSDMHITETINQAVSQNKPFYLLYRLKHTNGSWVWVEEYGTGVFEQGKLSHLEGFILKIDSRKRYALKLKKKNMAIQDLYKELEESEAMYKTLVDQIDYGIMVQQNKKIVFSNAAACQILEVESMETLLQSPLNKIFPRSESHMRSYNNLIKKTTNFSAEAQRTPLTTFKGSQKLLEISSSKILFKQKPAKLITFRDVSQEVENRQKIRENELRYSQVFHAAGSGMAIFSQKQKFLMVNDKFIEITGYTREEILNQMTWTDFFPVEVHEEIQNNVKQSLRSSKNQLFSRGVRIRTKRNGLKNAFLQISILPETNEFISSIIDLSHQYKAWEQVRKLQRAIEQSPTAIIVTNKVGRIEYVNPKYEQITGYRFSESVGKKPNVLKASILERHQYDAIKQAITQGREWRGEVLDQRKEGTAFWVDLSISPVLDENQQIQNIILIEEDISSRKKMEKELVTAKNKAEESDKLKSAFLANMSHEIRTPMNGILGFAQLLQLPDLTEEKIREYVGIINSRGKHLLRIIQDIIDISKIESQQVKPNIQSFSLNTLMDDMYVYFKKETEGKELHLLVDYGLKQGEDIIMSDTYKLQQILSNLIHNAIKYTREGLIQVGYKPRGNSELVFYVRDTGIGIPAEQQKLIFERFRQADNSYTREHGGTGLGLAICKGLVTLLGGTIKVSSELGEGSTFSFTIPWHPASAWTTNETIPTTSTPDWQGKTILIVEDDPTSMELITATLTKTNAILLKARDGYQAIELAAQHQPHLILMDIQLPELDGLTATSRIRKFLPHAPIIAQTAHAFANDKTKALKHGCTDFISKPLKINKLIAILMKYLGETGQ